MEEIDLYKFITENNIEWRWQFNSDSNEEDVIIFPYTFQIEDFVKLIGHIDETGLEMSLMDGYFAIWMGYVCDYYGINIER